MKSKIINLVILSVFVCMILAAPGYKDIAANISGAAGKHVVVLDPGHGGIDGGASSSDGTSEKDINLHIAFFLKQQLDAEDVKVIMTRTEDKGLYDESREGAVRSLKTEDMKVRKSIIDEADPDLAVSIHLNSFTQDANVRGAQVFYPSYGEDDFAKRSEAAAVIIQKRLNQEVNGEISRTELAKNDVYLLENISCPIVIVECGFLSNAEEADKLKTPMHQKKIAKVLAKGVCKYLNKSGVSH